MFQSRPSKTASQFLAIPKLRTVAGATRALLTIAAQYSGRLEFNFHFTGLSDRRIGPVKRSICKGDIGNTD